MDCSTLGFLVLHYLAEIAQTHVHRVSDTIQPSHPLPPPFSFCLQSFSASGSFPDGKDIRWPKFWSFNFSNSLFNEYSGLVSFKIDWFDLLAVQVTLKRLLKYHNTKGPILQCSAFFMDQLSHLYMTTALTRQIFVS